MRCPLFDKIVNKWALQVLYVDLLHFLQAYNVVWTSQTLVFGKVQFFFSGLMARPTYQPPVRHSDPNAPLGENRSLTSLSHENQLLDLNKQFFKSSSGYNDYIMCDWS